MKEICDGLWPCLYRDRRLTAPNAPMPLVDYIWSNVVTFGHIWSHPVIFGQIWRCVALSRSAAMSNAEERKARMRERVRTCTRELDPIAEKYKCAPTLVVAES